MEARAFSWGRVRVMLKRVFMERARSEREIELWSV